jgi:hypothetical protein
VNKMIIWLIDYDGKIENLALMRLSAYHKRMGDTVRLKFNNAYPELFETPDKIYISCLFRWNRKAAQQLADAWNGKAEIGGTGIDLAKRLPLAISDCQPDYDLYGNQRAIGFISRGCIRKCPWCVVPTKEGKLCRESTAQKIVKNHSEALFLDNNFLALPDYSADLEWLAKHQIAIDFNQGLDARLVTEGAAKLLAKCKWLTGPRLALDSLSQIKAVDLALSRLKNAGISPTRVFLFILIGFDGLESDVERLLFAHEWNVNAFPMGYRDLETGEEPAIGWNRKFYNKYRRLIIRMPHAKSVWNDFKKEVC